MIIMYSRSRVTDRAGREWVMPASEYEIRVKTYLGDSIGVEPDPWIEFIATRGGIQAIRVKNIVDVI